MKKNYLFTGVAVSLLLLATSVLPPVKAKGEKSATPFAVVSIPDDLKTIFEKSCMSCHATGGRNMAMAKLNFSNWDSYESDKQAKKAAAICKMITKGAMPPKSFRASNPDAIPTAAQKDMICTWSGTLTQKK